MHNHITQFDWQNIFVLDTPNLDLLVRGTFMFFFLYILIQIMNRKLAGKVSNINFLLIVLIADISQNAIAGNYNSLSAGIILVLTVFVLSYIINLVSYKFRFIEKLIAPDPLPLVINGELQKENMHKCLVTRKELAKEKVLLPWILLKMHL